MIDFLSTNEVLIFCVRVVCTRFLIIRKFVLAPSVMWYYSIYVSYVFGFIFVLLCWSCFLCLSYKTSFSSFITFQVWIFILKIILFVVMAHIKWTMCPMIEDEKRIARQKLEEIEKSKLLAGEKEVLPKRRKE